MTILLSAINGSSTGSGDLLSTNNLSDLTNVATARTNLGLGTAATADSTTFALATSVFSGDYNDLANKPTIPTVPTNVSAFTNDSGYITSYTVTEGDVTAHQAALSITESQISDLGSYATINNATFTGDTTANNYVDTVYTLTGTALDPANGNVQTKTMAANTTFTDSLTTGESMVLVLSGGDTYTATYPTMTWAGGSAPTLTSDDALVFWKIGSTLYGAYIGSVA